MDNRTGPWHRALREITCADPVSPANRGTVHDLIHFPPLAPDFVVEIRSESDSLKPLRDKMHEYIELGVRLGWLIDPVARRVEVYRPDKKPQTLKVPRTVSGDPVLPGFVLRLERIWSD